MSETLTTPGYNIEPLTRDIAEQYVHELTALANQIPEVTYTPEDILADKKADRQLLNKWSHSLIVFDGDKPAAFIMGYERAAEGGVQYPRNTLYISELAVGESHQRQGLARNLLKQFLERNIQTGFQSLSGDLNFSLQTNSAPWNEHVINLYKSFGFKQRATKEYTNRTDIILGADLSEITEAQ
jgi:ribosomal protein S18 acetylase RimI-like enzyme